MLTQTLIYATILLAVSVGLSALLVSSTFLLCVIAALKNDPVGGEEALPVEDAEQPQPAAVRQTRVLHCYDCRRLARDSSPAPAHCHWCDLCEADSLAALIEEHATTKLERVMAKRMARGVRGKPDLKGLRELLLRCYQSGLGG